MDDKTSVLLLTKLNCHVCNFVSYVSPFQGLFDIKLGRRAHGDWMQLPHLQVALQLGHRGGINITYEQDAIEHITAQLHKGTVLGRGQGSRFSASIPNFWVEIQDNYGNQ